MADTQPVVLSIAGFDPASGAGVTADIKTLAAHNCYGLACITALTVQSTTGVRQVLPVSGRLVADTLSELNHDFNIAAVRIGMLGSGEVVEAVIDYLKKYQPPNVVLDPIFKSSGGASLLDDDAIESLRRNLLPLAWVITPNVEEAATLTAMPVTSIAGMKAAANRLHEFGARAVVVTGGDMANGHPEKCTDLLSISNGSGESEQSEFASVRLRSRSTHGTGCAFASALAANLALGKQLPDAVVLAKAYVKHAMASAHPLGKGVGPLNHLYRLEEHARPVQDTLAPTEH
jgi:hydroxymethylpyrimidine kinase/phosphomethylpyrimidine kinase